MTYVLISLPFVIFATIIFVWSGAQKATPAGIPLAVGGLTMFVLTLIFDNLIIGTGIVAYNDELFLGVKLGLAPIEDFLYTLAAILLIPACWNLLEKRGFSR